MKNKITKVLALIIALVFCVGALAACNSGGGEAAPAETTAAETTAAEETTEAETTKDASGGLEGEISVYAAASMTESLNEAISIFNETYPDVEVIANYGSSGDLVKQIIEGGECDIFISAANKQMNQVDATADAEANPDGNDYVMQGTRVSLLENKCVLAVPDDNPAGINSFDDLAGAFENPEFIFAMGGESVPVGAYTQSILSYLNLDEASLANQISYGEDVKAVTSAVKEGTAQAGVIYATDAFSAGLTTVDEATEEMTDGRVLYPAAIINTGKNYDLAEIFFDFIQGPEASACFEAVGFTTLSSSKAVDESLTGELSVYAAASMTESLGEAIKIFNETYPNVEVVANYGSSGDLVKQIIEGGECDVFISAANKQMNQIDSTSDAEANPDGNDYVVQGTRVSLLENKCVLAVPDDNPAGINSFDDLAAAFENPEFIFAMGGESVPVGAYTQAILASLNLDEASLANQISYGEDVKAVTSAVKEGTAQAGVIYATDAFSAELTTVGEATEEMTGGRVLYPAAQITTGTNADAGAAFMQFLVSPEASACFEAVGFTTLN